MTEYYKITVFGGSKSNPEDQLYRQALTLGQLLAEASFVVQTGGYIGTMEAVSRGAAEAGGHVVGITCDEIESWRPVGPNPWVKEEIRYPTLKGRLSALIMDCHAAIALPGGIGTLQEIVVMWAQLQVGAVDRKPLILVGEGWDNTISAFYKNLGEYIPEGDMDWLCFSPDIIDAVQVLKTRLFSQ